MKKGNHAKIRGVLVESLRKSFNIRNKLLMVCCLSPSIEDFEANQNSLKVYKSIHQITLIIK